MIVVVFRSRARADNRDAYNALGEEMDALARSMPGFISAKDYMSDDGEKITIVEWATAEQLKAWREHPDHAKAQARGRAEFYEEYTLYVCENPRESRFKR